MTTLTTAQIARQIVNGHASEPDPIVRDLVPEVARLWAAYEEAAAGLATLRAELHEATRQRADWRHDPAAVFSYVAGTLTFSDAEGVARNNRVKAAEAAIRAHEARVLRARLAYLEAAIEAAGSVKAEARERMAEAHAAAKAAADALLSALRERTRYWRAAGQPVGEAVAPEMVQYVRSQHQGEHAQAVVNLEALLPKVLALPSALAREIQAEA